MMELSGPGVKPLAHLKRTEGPTEAERLMQEDGNAQRRGVTPDKGNLDLLRGTDGQLKRAVTLEIARRYADVSRRAIDDAAKKGTLKTEGKHQRRRVLVESLLKYSPSEK